MIWKILCCSVQISRKQKSKEKGILKKVEKGEKGITKQNISKIVTFSVGLDACPNGAQGLIKNKEPLIIKKSETRNEELVVSVRI
jgi:hypothetical protein